MNQSEAELFLAGCGASGPLQVLANAPGAPPREHSFERPFIVAHEWSHLAGFADEAEANFVGWLTCLRGSEADQYSGWLFLYSEVSSGLSARDRAAVAAVLNAGPREDLRAIARRLAQEVNPRVSAAGWRVYDSYLKANRIQAGTASYDEVVRLVLGVRGVLAGVERGQN